MQVPINKKRIRFYLWVGLAWLIFWLFADLVQYPGLFFKYFFNEIWRAIYIVAVNFLFFEITLPFIGAKRKNGLLKILLGLLVLSVQLMLYSFGLYGWRELGIELHIYTAIRTFPSPLDGVASTFSSSVISIFFFGVLRHLYDHNNLKKTARQLRIEKQEAELNYLKSQTNPHFLFNTLNNIYSLARDKSDLAPESILRLSKILRFMLYETGGDYIRIEQELKIISDYIALEKLRYDDSLRVSFQHDIEDKQQALPPLLLIPLVENAFKHGVSETREQPFVDIQLSVRQQQLAFRVSNSTDQAAPTGPVKEKIGLSNLRRQLQLLYTDHYLAVEQGNGIFTATLKINLKHHD